MVVYVTAAGCDHRHESRSCQPGDTLRHLVEIRTGTARSRPDPGTPAPANFEHAVPYDQGGRAYTQGPMKYPA